MRLGAQAKMGYYPTPEILLPQLIRHLQRGGPGSIRVFDPCAGTGAAIREIADHLGALAYGIELDKDRGEQAKRILDQCLICDQGRSVVSHGSMSLLYLNPPYDWDARESEIERSERYERTFLRDTIRYLCPGGVLAYLIPQHRLDSAIARVLAYRFGQLRLYRFPEELYQQFRQVVIFGVLRRQPAIDETVCRYLQEVGAGRALAHKLPEESDHIYQVPPSPRIKPLVFRSSEIDLAQLERELRSQGVFPRVFDLINPPALDRKIATLMPLRHGHLAQLVACGMVGGVVRDKNGDNPLVVKGGTKKVVDRRVERDGDVERHIETDRLVITIQAFNQDGDLITIQ